MNVYPLAINMQKNIVYYMKKKKWKIKSEKSISCDIKLFIAGD